MTSPGAYLEPFSEHGGEDGRDRPGAGSTGSMGSTGSSSGVYPLFFSLTAGWADRWIVDFTDGLVPAMINRARRRQPRWPVVSSSTACVNHQNPTTAAAASAPATSVPPPDPQRSSSQPPGPQAGTARFGRGYFFGCLVGSHGDSSSRRSQCATKRCRLPDRRFCRWWTR